MMRSLIQFEQNGARGVAALDAQGQAYQLNDTASTLALAHDALAKGASLAGLATARRGDALDLAGVTLLSPIDHEDPAHLLVSGTGLTHLGSAEGRDKMHKAAAAGAATDSMRMFLEGEAGGKPVPGSIGQQPEWFYKGDGSILVAPGTPLHRPGFAQDGGEEPEIAGIYVIDANRTPVRLGFALGNEFSDHVTERHNYLWLAHSKLRQAALGPELLLGSLPEDIRGTSRIIRGGAILWEKPFVSGEANMLNIIISNTRNSAAQATCMCISLAPPPYLAPTGSKRRRAMCLKCWPMPSPCPSATRWYMALKTALSRCARCD